MTHRSIPLSRASRTILLACHLSARLLVQDGLGIRWWTAGTTVINPTTEVGGTLDSHRNTSTAVECQGLWIGAVACIAATTH